MTWSKKLKTKVCLVGQQGVGKTSLVRRFVRDEFDDRYISTLGVKTSKKEMTVPLLGKGSLDVHLAIWDFMGQEGFRDLLKEAYFTGARGILAVADLTRRPSLEALGPWIETVRSVAGNIPLVLAMNKSDLSDHAVYPADEVAQFATTYGAPYLLTSAKTSSNVEAAFGRLARAVAELYAEAA
jgi:small GTP-binding protein